jgi:type I restriction enzyme, S subunit
LSAAALHPHPYLETRDSGVRWLGKVPTHWELAPLGRIGRFFKGTGGTKEDEVADGIPCIRYGDLYSKYGAFITKAASFVAPERAGDYTPIDFGDVLFAGSGETLEEIGKSAVNLIEGDVVCGGDVLVFRPKREILPRFLGYAADCSSSVYQKACMGRGITVMHIYADELKQLRIALPPVDEQAAIIRFLDHTRRRIGHAIRGKQKLIALLNEQRQTVIHRVVTRGLDPNVRLKPSGADWLGDVPEHWRVLRVKNVLRPVDERSVTGAEPLLSLRRDYGVVKFSDHFSRPPQAATTVGYKLVAPGDVVVNRLQANNGLIFRSAISGLISPDYSTFSVQPAANGEYVTAVLRMPHYRAHFRRSATGLGTGTGGFLRLYDDAFLTTPFALPPLVEQELIMSSLDVQTRQAAEGIRVAKTAVQVLREYGTRLIADVVTGQLDVREAAAALPQEIDEVEPFDEGVLDEIAEDGVEDLEAVEA